MDEIKPDEDNEDVSWVDNEVLPKDVITEGKDENCAVSFDNGDQPFTPDTSTLSETGAAALDRKIIHDSKPYRDEIGSISPEDELLDSEDVDDVLMPGIPGDGKKHHIPYKIKYDSSSRFNNRSRFNDGDIKSKAVRGSVFREETYVDYKRVTENIMRSVAADTRPYNINRIDVSKENLVNVSLLNLKNDTFEEKKVVETPTSNVKEDKNAKRKQLLKLYQDNNTLEGYESAVDIRYVVDEKSEVPPSFFQRIFDRFFKRRN